VTDDVDIVVELIKYTDYANIEDQLRKKGFVNDIASGIIGRYKINGVIVDLMPTEETVLGFKNKWYAEGFRNSIAYPINAKDNIRIFNAVYFLASKLDAFNDRGKNDGRTSSDFEDIVYVLNNRNAVWNEMKIAAEPVKTFLQTEFKKISEHKFAYEWISAHLEYSEQHRANVIFERLIDFSNV